MHLGEIVNRYRKENNITMDEFAKKSGLSKGYISMLEKNEDPKTKKEIIPTLETINRVAEVIGMDLDTLLKHLGRNQKVELPSANNIIPLPKTKRIPLLGKIACGSPITAEENIEDYVDVPEFTHADFALTCQGDSMINARVMDGDIVYIRLQPEVENGEIAAVLIDGEATLKRVYYQKGKIILQPENNNYPPLIYEKDEILDVRILGKATYFLSKMK